MKFFTKMYAKVMVWSKHKHAPWYLYGLSFLESSVFPIPPDVMLAPMSLAHPERAWTYATFTTIASVLGGIFGYILGKFFFVLIHPYIHQFGYDAMYQQILIWFKVWGFWIILIAGCAPIPYKLFTIAAGVVGMPLIPFVLGSILGRGGRFFLVSGLMKWGGVKMEKMLIRYLDRLGWLFCLIIVIALGATHSQDIYNYIS